jgi:plasmid stabilization system protein ParE
VRPIVFNSRAREDVFEIWEHIAIDNVDAADRLIRRIEDDILKLAEMPLCRKPPLR